MSAQTPATVPALHPGLAEQVYALQDRICEPLGVVDVWDTWPSVDERFSQLPYAEQVPGDLGRAVRLLLPAVALLNHVAALLVDALAERGLPMPAGRWPTLAELAVDDARIEQWLATLTVEERQRVYAEAAQRGYLEAP